MSKNLFPKKSNCNPWLFVPTQYFAEGLPYVIVNNLSVVMYKSLGISNDLIGYTSLLYLPWALKPLWSPVVDGNSTKRSWVLSMQLLLAVLFFGASLTLFTNSFFILSLIIFTIIAFISATHDIATDGFYLHSLDSDNQALFVGIRNTFYRVSMIFGSGLLVIIAGEFGGKFIEKGWGIALSISAVLFLLIYIYHLKILPFPASDAAVRERAATIPFIEVFKQFFTQEKIIIILVFILVYRLGESMLLKMAQPFMLDKSIKGGLELSVSQVGMIYGTMGIIALLTGGILGGWLIKKYNLKKLFFPMALAMHLPNILYIYLAATKPSAIIPNGLEAISSIFDLSPGMIFSNFGLVLVCVIIEQFGYGLGFTAYMVFLMYISKGKYKTSHYAISTGFMALGMMIPGALSGWLQLHIGYLWLFVISTILTLPGTILIFYLPYNENIKS